MTHSPTKTLEHRALTIAEATVVRWLLEHGEPGATDYLAQLEQSTVVAKCSCGCASIDFAVAGKHSQDPAMHVLSDFQWRDVQGNSFGAFAFERGGLLAGLDLWSVDGQATPSDFPPIERLVPYGTPQQL